MEQIGPGPHGRDTIGEFAMNAYEQGQASW